MLFLAKKEEEETMEPQRITDAREAVLFMMEVGKKLMHAHLTYEDAEPFPLVRQWTPGVEPSFVVTKMRFTDNDRRTVRINDTLSLTGIPAKAHEYRLGNKSALEWVIDQYQVTRDARSGIVSDPNREDDPEYIVRLLCQVVTVSLETVRLTDELAARVDLDDFDLTGAGEDGNPLSDAWKS